MEETNTLKDEIKKLNLHLEKLVESGIAKPFTPPKKIRRWDLVKNYTLAIVIGENREIKFLKVPIDEGTAIINNCPRLATTDYILSYQGKPALIIPEWSVEPFSPTSNYEQAIRDKTLAAGWRLLSNKLEQGTIKPQMKLSGGMIFAIIVGLLLIGYLIFFR